MKIPETTLNDIDREVSEEVEKQNVDRIDVTYLVNAIIEKHEDITGGDADYAVLCVCVTVRQRVDVYVRRTKKAEKKKNFGKEEMLPGMEGYTYLQDRYVVNGVLVKIDAMTDEEFAQKIEEHYAQGDGHYAHGAELARYQTELRTALATQS